MTKKIQTSVKIVKKQRPPACWRSHKPMPIVVNDSIEKTTKTYQIRGGSCLFYPEQRITCRLGLDDCMVHSALRYPWTEGEEVFYPIEDQGVPGDFDEFRTVIRWLIYNITKGEQVHIGCIGGHGRTGLVLAVLVYKMMGEIDAIQYVRDNYCPKAIESRRQIDWLRDKYGLMNAMTRDQYLSALHAVDMDD